MTVCALSLAACNATKPDRAEINEKTKFSQAEYGVKASPRVTTAKQVPKGGGNYMVGKPYKVRGRWYKPKEDPNYAATGLASWYGPNFHGRKTANGEIFDQYSISAAHPTMPLPSYARVTNLDNGSSLIVRVNDRGPFAKGRVIDLSARAAKLLGYADHGVTKVKVEYVGKARIDGHDEKFLMASYRTKDAPYIEPGATMPGTMLAMATEPVPAAPIAAQSLEGQVQLALAANIPIPDDRPSTFDGITMDMAEPILTASVAPLGFAPEGTNSRRFAAAFAAFDAPAASLKAPSGETDAAAAATTTVLRLGIFAEPRNAEYVRQTVADLGITAMRRVLPDNAGEAAQARSGWEVRLLVGGDVAAEVLAVLHERGLSQAEIVTR